MVEIHYFWPINEKWASPLHTLRDIWQHEVLISNILLIIYHNLKGK